MKALLLDHIALHSIGLCVAGLVVLLIRSGWRRDPVLAYRLLSAVLLATLLLPLGQTLVQGRAPDALRERLAAARPLLPLRLGNESTPAAAATSAVREQALLELSRDASPRRRPAAVITSSAIHRAAPAMPPAAGDPLDPEADHALTGSRSGPLITTALAWVIIAIYLSGVVGFAFRSLRRLLATRRLVRSAEAIPAAEIDPLWNRVAHGSALRERIRLLRSAQLEAPACWGLLRPVIIIPAGQRERSGSPAFQWALLHELIHLERRDPLLALLQSVMTTLFWFHPVAHWFARQLEVLREQSCDLLVVDRAGKRRSYALALLSYAHPEGAEPDILSPGHHPPGAGVPALLHWCRSPSQLKRRIEMLLKTRGSNRKGRRLLVASCAGLLLSAIWAGQIALASTFTADDEEALVACDPKDKKNGARRSQRDFRRPPTTPLRDPGGEADITRQGNRARPQVASGEPLDQLVRAAMIQTLLNDDDDNVKMTAARALAPHVQDEEVKRGFLKAIRNSCNDACRLTLIDSLLSREAIDDDVKDLLVRAFSRDGDSGLRRGLRQSLATISTGPEARDHVIAALSNGRSDLIQLNASESLAPHAGDPAVRSALANALRKSDNEVARMVMIDALEPYVTESSEVRETFLRIIENDDNEVAKMTVARSLAEQAGHPDVRAVMIRTILGKRNDVIKLAFVDALGPFIYEPEVKAAFIKIIPHLGNELVRMKMVRSLASIITPEEASPWQGQDPHMLPSPRAGAPLSESDLIPVMQQKRG